MENISVSTIKKQNAFRTFVAISCT